MDYKQKYLKYKQKYLNLKNQIGGEQILLRQIKITKRIIDAIQKINPSIDTSMFLSYHDGTFPLSRMDRMMTANIDTLLDNDPVDLAKSSETINIDGKDLPIYLIRNGRHRIARSILEGKTHINATIS